MGVAQKAIFERARELGIIPFQILPFDNTAVDSKELNVDFYKIASFRKIRTSLNSPSS